ncbi:MAG: CDP-alcohol phosphatidyltransferase family protein [Clostridia bacterium]|nr:CDP-alcohol phosphatidyltransferase family protein [Clostridia bacterium]
MARRTFLRQLLTVPNLLSMMRIALIPGIMLHLREGRAAGCVLLLMLSGVTDLLDGWIARRYHAVTNVGKVLDPVADKLTVVAVLAVLVSRHSALILPLALLVIREITMGVSGAVAVVRTSRVPSACWHGKLTTALLYSAMILHIIWQEIPPLASNMMAMACTVMMAFSMTCYTCGNVRRIRTGKEGA